MRPKNQGKRAKSCRDKNGSTRKSKVSFHFKGKCTNINCGCYGNVNSVLSECVFGMFVRQNCGGRLGAASGLKTPAFTSISTDQRRWWIQRRISTRKPALPADMNSPMRRCRHAQASTSALIPLLQFSYNICFSMSEINLPHNFVFQATTTSMYYLKKPIEASQITNSHLCRERNS